ncbi:ABC transporter substrate-binding protein, partial [Glaesserella parasuis]|uniref:ABC transporter substrate-binding protein n=1 Tax=Glaesserella parasuis TaxID=738 RepID=UPI003B68232C
AKLKNEGVDVVILGTPIRESVAAVAEARKAGWNVDMMVTTSGYAPEVVKLGGDTVEGLYGTAQTPIPYYETASPELKAWIESYKKQFNTDPNPQ